EVIGEYMGEGVVAPMFMIRRGNYKYICSKPDPDQLFNLMEDPEERINLAEDEKYRELAANFRREAASRWDSDAITRDVIISQKRRRLVAEAHKLGKAPVWDHQPIFDASQMYMRNTIDLDDLEKRARFPQVSDE
ncbi:MAG: choline-sulfatase, partial [Gammaproteobacteria bacterium]|nr:choline-sulfatase [Gammaproteobacteria bacterium]